VKTIVLLCALLCLPLPVLAQARSSARCTAAAPEARSTAEFAFVGHHGQRLDPDHRPERDVIVRPTSGSSRTKPASSATSRNRNSPPVVSGISSRRAGALAAPIGVGEYAYFRDTFAGVAHRNSARRRASPTSWSTCQTRVLHRCRPRVHERAAPRRRRRVERHLSLGAGYKWKISETAEFTEDFRMTGIFADADDWRILQAAAITARPHAAVLAEGVEHDSIRPRAVPGFKDTDTTTSVALVAKF